MRKTLALGVVLGLALICVGLVYAQTQADVTFSITIKANDAAALKDILETPAGPFRDRLNEYVDPASSKVTDALLQKWAKDQLREVANSLIRQSDDQKARALTPDWASLTPAQKAEILAVLKKYKK
jgi:hypothetical protein